MTKSPLKRETALTESLSDTPDVTARANPCHRTRLSRPKINVLLLGEDLKLTRTSIGWHPARCHDSTYSPATISSLWERGLLDANFIDLRVIYGARGLIDMKSLDGARYAHLPEMPKFQVWTSALGKEALKKKGLLFDDGHLQLTRCGDG